MIHPHHHRCFFTTEKSGLSALDIRNLVYTGEIDRWDTVSDTAGAMHYAQSIADFREPRWLRTLANDPVCRLTDADAVMTDDELISDLEDDFFEGMPPEVLPMQHADCWMQAAT